MEHRNPSSRLARLGAGLSATLSLGGPSLASVLAMLATPHPHAEVHATPHQFGNRPTGAAAAKRAAVRRNNRRKFARGCQP